MSKYELKLRKQIAKEIFKLAYKVRDRDKWFIGGFISAVEEEWDNKNE